MAAGDADGWGRCPPLSAHCVEPGVEAVMESRVESSRRARAPRPVSARAEAALRLRLLGPMTVTRGAAELALPRSRGTAPGASAR